MADLWYLGLVVGFFALTWAFVVLYLVFTITQAKVYFLSPAYPPLFACGAVAITGLSRPWRGIATAVICALLVVSGVVLAPLAMPTLSILTRGVGAVNVPRGRPGRGAGRGLVSAPASARRIRSGRSSKV